MTTTEYPRKSGTQRVFAGCITPGNGFGIALMMGCPANTGLTRVRNLLLKAACTRSNSEWSEAHR